jgi:glycosyltransferase involved in cell wall biosynthesis
MIPAFNQADVVGTALKSAFLQDYPNLEIIVSDDCSTDGTEEGMTKYISDDRLKYYRNSKNLGRVGNYRQALEHYAKGDWVINLDADDYFTDSSFISRFMKLILANRDKNIVFVQAGHEIRNADQSLVQKDLPDIEESVAVLKGKSYFFHFSHFSHLATLYHRAQALAIDFYRYDILSSDIESFLRLALLGDVIMVKEVVGVWMQHDNNQSRKLTIEVLDKNLLSIEGPYVFAKEGNYIPYVDLNNWRQKMIYKHLMHHFYMLIRLKGPVRSYLRYLIKNFPGVVFNFTFLKGLLKYLFQGRSQLPEKNAI